MSEFAVSRPVTVIMVSIGLIVIGVISAFRTPVQLLPSIVSPEFSIVTSFPGATPLEVEEKVTTPIEDAVSTSGGLYQTVSYSDLNRSTVNLKYTSDIDVLQTISDIREKLDGLNFDNGVARPKIVRFNPDQLPVVRAAIGLTSDSSASLSDLVKALRDGLLPKLDMLDGVALAEILGSPEEEVLVELIALKALAYDVDVAEVSQLIKANNTVLPGGRINDSGLWVNLRLNQKLTSVDDLRRLIVKQDGGKTVRLQDIATVKVVEKKPDIRAHFNGVPSIILDVKKESEANAVKVAQDARKIIESTLKENNNFEGKILIDQGSEINSSVEDVVDNIVSGGLLAAFIIFIFLQSVVPTLIVCLAIPMSIAMTLTLMYFSGLSFNLMSLGGLGLGVGMLMDNSISVLENINCHKAKTDDIKQAVIWGAREVSGSIIASTLCTISVFAPLAFVDGLIGQLFRDISLTVVYSILSSLVVALVLIPTLSSLEPGHTNHPQDAKSGNDLKQFVALLEHQNVATEQKGAWLFAFSFFVRILYAGQAAAILLLRSFILLLVTSAKISLRYFGVGLSFGTKPLMQYVKSLLEDLMIAYSDLLRSVLKKRRTPLLSVLVLSLMAFVGIATIGGDLFPREMVDKVTYTLEFDPGQPKDINEKVVSQIERDLIKIPGVKGLSSLTGDRGPEFASLMVLLEAQTMGELSAIESNIQSVLAEVPDVVSHKLSDSIVSTSKPIEVEIFEHDLSKLVEAATVAKATAKELSVLKDVESSVKRKISEVNVNFDKSKLDKYQMTHNAFTDKLITLVQGSEAGTLSLSAKQIPIVTKGSDREFNSLGKLKHFSVLGDSKSPVSLSQVSTLKIGDTLSQIMRIDRKRAATVSADLSESDLETASKTLHHALTQKLNHSGIAWKIGGQDIERQRSQQSLLFAIGLSVFLIYVLLASQFESFRQPAIILFAAPLSLVGVTIALYATDSKVSAMVLVGFVILIGMTVNTSIVLVDTINQKIVTGLPRFEAIVHACKARLTPVLMNALSNIIGLVPMAMGIGQGAGLRQPLAITIIGGMLSSTILTLIVIPIVYDLVTRREDGATP